MADPVQGGLVALERILRYLKGYPRLLWRFPWQGAQSTVQAYCYSDWAGCRRTIRSTSGGVVRIGNDSLCHWSRTQATVALSSAEAELNGSLTGYSELLFLKNMIEEIDGELQAEVLGDSSARRGIRTPP